MINITCTQCRALLTIDEAFAGGVCRCQHCGTIQTVPAQLKSNPTPYVGPSATTSKALYQNQAASRVGGSAAGQNSPSGLDQLAQAVVSSGLSGSGLRTAGAASNDADAGSIPTTPQAKAAPPAEKPAKRASPAGAVRKPPILQLAIAGGALLLAGVAVIVYFAFFHGGSSDSSSGSGQATFCGIPIGSSNVVYVLDRGNSLRDDFDELKAATYQSITSLGPDGKFAVMLWNNGAGDVAFPDSGLRNATADQTEMLHKQLDAVVATGASRLRGALERAMARNPSTIVIVSAKNKLDEDDENAVATAQETAAGKIKFDAFVIGSLDNAFLKTAAKATGGQYHLFSSSALRSATP